MHFGHLALMQNKARAGTVVCLSGCIFAVIGAEAYEKLLKKENASALMSSVNFFK